LYGQKCWVFEIALASKGGGVLKFWHLRGFVPPNWSRWSISQKKIRTIYTWSRDSIWNFSTNPINHQVNHGSKRVLQLFRKKKDPRAKMGNFWGFVKISEIVWILVFRSCFFQFLPQQQGIASNVTKFREKGSFSDVSIQGLFIGNGINVTLEYEKNMV
jgi:hypothetical protein